MRTDRYGRSFRSLRISLTRACNFACAYCVSPEEKGNGRRSILAPETLVSLTARLRKFADLKEIRLTGGEPLLYPGLPELIRGLSGTGLPVKMTTNGYLLKNKARSLKEAGLLSLNVSLDAAEPAIFHAITRRNCFRDVVEGIDRALEEGMELKLNAVIMRGRNEDQILPLLEFAAIRRIPVRYLELMEMGHLKGSGNADMVSEKEVLDVIGSRFSIYPCERIPSSTARYFVTDTFARFGLISNSSEPFCHDCDRLRLDSHGNIFGCLSSNLGIPVLEADEAALEEKLSLALSQKKIAFAGSTLSMKSIGG